MIPSASLLDSSENVGKISELTGFPPEFCELAVKEWLDASEKIGVEPMIDRLPSGGFHIRHMDRLRHARAVLKKLSSLNPDN